MSSFFPNQPPPLKDAAPIIVIGSGIAGLYTALQLNRKYPVILLSKTELSESNTTYAQGGIAAAIGANDSPDLHYQDTIMAGAGLCKPEAVMALVYDGPERVRHLIDLNVNFDRSAAGEISLTREAAHSRRRILHAYGDATGRGISQALIAHMRETPGVRIYENTFALALATRNGRCAGVVAIRNGSFQLFMAQAVVLCSGGLGQLFGKTTNPDVATGDGYSLAFNCGATLQDMEFIQFHPTALYLPPAPPFLISEAVRGEGAILLNSKGERFMPGYHSLAELAPRDVVARSIFTELTRNDDPCVYLDLVKLSADTIKTRFPNIYDKCLKFGLDISTSPIPVAPAAHYMMGGISTDLWGRTTVPGLYAAGEVAATGVHGANRLASNSLLEGLVFGGRIAEYLISEQFQTPESISGLTVHYPKLLTSGENLAADYLSLRHITDYNLGIVRHQTSLQSALTKLNELRQEHPEAIQEPAYFELQFMIQQAVMATKAALTREESRGGHFRGDFPASEAAWRRHIIFHRDEDQTIMEVTK